MNACKPSWISLLRCTLVVMLIVCGMASPANAHANLERSTPLQDAELKESPGEIRIQFTENIDPKLSTIALENEKGAKVAGELRSEKGNVLIYKIGKLDNGIYKVKWQVLSVDTHVTEGSYRFSINTPMEKSRPSETISLDGDPRTQGKADTGTTDSQIPASTAIPSSAQRQQTDDHSSQEAHEPGTASEAEPHAEGRAPLTKPVATAPTTSSAAPSVSRAESAAEVAETAEAIQPSASESVRESPADSNGRTALVERMPVKQPSTDSPIIKSSPVVGTTDSTVESHDHGHDHDGGSHEPIDWRSFVGHVLRIADVLAVVALTGFLFFRDAVWGRNRGTAPPPFSERNEKKLALLAALILLAAGIAQVWLLAERLSESGMYPLGERARMIVASTLFGASAWLRPVAALLIFMLAFAPERDRRWAGWLKAIAACGLIVTFPLTGHAFAGESGKWTAVFSHTLHMLASALWFGGLTGLFAATFAAWERAAIWMELDALITRFSAFALPLIGIVTASGVWLTVVRLEGWTDLTNSGYGRLVLVKSGLLFVVLVIAVFHRLRFMPRIRSAISGSSAVERTKALRGFVFGVRAEIVLAAALFVLAGMLTTTAPPADGVGADPVYWHEMGEKAHMSLRISSEANDRQSVRLDVWLPSGVGAPAGTELRLQTEADEQPAISLQVPLSFVVGGPDPYGYEGFHKYTYEAAGNFMKAGVERWDIKVHFTDSLNQTFTYNKNVALR
ncbi:MAG: copper resistance protein CopC [Paenibacillus sp.]|nr:copper resistance protein CopC [Paenibacillus sp.]